MTPAFLCSSVPSQWLSRLAAIVYGIVSICQGWRLAHDFNGCEDLDDFIMSSDWGTEWNLY